ncbi:MAG: S41 family peptidase [Bryobacteraceae bacterium]
MHRRLRTIILALSTCLAAFLLIGAVLDKPGSDTPYKQLGVFTEVLHRIKSDYVEEPDLKSVTLGAINGLLQAIDPFASYLNAEQYKEYLKNKDALGGDVGLLLSWKYGYLGVAGTVPGSPAARAGLVTGDMIETIRGISTRDMPLAYAEMLLRGKPGTTVEISVLSLRQQEPRKLTLTREPVRFPRLTWRMLEGQISYLQVSTLAPGKAAEAAEGLRELLKQGAQKLVLDLRNCAAGTVEEGVALANLFLEKGLITYVEGQRYKRQEFRADPEKTVWKLPMVVITNRGTAGGAEVAAAALLEHKRAEIVGEPTFGNAAVRKAVNLDDGGAIILAVAKYYTPSGKAIQDVRVTPTVQVIESEPIPETEEEAAPPETERAPKPEEDRLLEKAIEVLTKGKPLGPPTAWRIGPAAGTQQAAGAAREP